MSIRIQPGTYVVAVSGGVDSMVLLDLLANSPELIADSRKNTKGYQPSAISHKLIVAHFDHGIREDSAEDFKLVKATAKKYGLPFAAAHGNLGPEASEAAARTARYNFLRQTMAEEGARAIITAHHQDDMLETAIINLLRGTGRKGLSSLASRGDVIRPLLEWTKKDIREYAENHHVKWREDSTNADERYLRNYVRRNILARFGAEARNELLEKIRSIGKANEEIDQLLDEDLQKQPAPDELNRTWYLQLPYAVASEMMAAWLRRNGIAGFNRTLVDQLVIAAKTARPGKLADVDSGHLLEFKKETIKLRNRPWSSVDQK